MNPLRLLVLAALLLSVPAAPPAAAQIMQVGSGDSGTLTYLSETPSMVDGLMLRANGVETDTLGWALTVQGTEASTAIQVEVDGASVDVLRLATNTEAPGGRTTIFLSEDAFRRMANAESVQLTVGEQTITLPDGLKRDMRLILQRLLG